MDHVASYVDGASATPLLGETVGAMLARIVARWPERRVCIPVLFYHCFGMVLGNLACVTHGACMVIPGEGFDALATLETVAEERCTGLAGSPCSTTTVTAASSAG
jgi:acyl-CoA synthetase (AMP-forming)/AMP-acid ligase II